MADNQDLLAMTHVGEDPHKYMKSVTPPVFMNSLHVFDTVKDYFDVDIFDDEFYYGRASNPTVAILEKKIAALEHGSRAVVFSAGMAACAAAILRICTAGSHVICIKESYGPVQHLLDEFLEPKYNISVTYVDGRTVKEFEGAIRPEYIKRGLESKNLSRSLEDSITVVEPLVPWSLAGVYMTSVLGVPTVQYAPWAVLCYTGVFFAILWGFTGFGIKKITKDSPAYEEYLQLSGKSAEE